MYDQPARGDAALPAGLEGADQAARDREIELGVRADDDGAFAAGLAGDDAIRQTRRDFADAFADVVAAGEEDAVDARIAHQGLARFRFAMDEIDDAGRKAGF